ncbi:TRPM8 channel-associated factor homolog [Rhinatrema bivittatum]|uniref:TRPM8 channel-associated factor homolog n=1 Tax=Rhinatrema bivittatum TaxID=194408 RepID=UPI00112C2293|nr:TRPM8 channel-associated factor homolog [Rhinatrema bivittatum]
MLKMQLSDAYKALVEGISELDFSGSCVPCDLLLTGDESFPVLVNPKDQVLIAASQYGKGRMVVLSHNEYLNDPRFSRFLRNAIGWLRSSPEALVGIQGKFSLLEKTLSSNGARVQSSTKFLDAFGVYCMDAYDDRQAEELVKFMKAGGGLLIGGQACQWAQRQGATADVFSFPGNNVTAVAGIHFTSSCAETGIFPISVEMPLAPLWATHGIDFTKDLNVLLDGVTELNIKTGQTVSLLFVHGPLAFPIGVNEFHQPIFAAARYGKGRIVVLTHEDCLVFPQLKKFMLNAVSWLGTGRQGKIGIESKLEDFYQLLSQENIDCEQTYLVPNLSVYCCRSYSDQEAAKIDEFVTEGGGLLISGHAWWWKSQNPAKNVITDYPGNKILNKFGISIFGDFMITTKCKPWHDDDKSRRYLFRKALSHFRQYFNDEGEMSPQLSSWMKMLREDCMLLAKVPDQGFPVFSSICKQLKKLTSCIALPTVGEKCPVRSNSKEGFSLSLATEFYNSCPCEEGVAPQKWKMNPASELASHHPMRLQINCTNTGPTAWRSTGLYLAPQATGTVTFPRSIAEKGLQVQIGCQSDDLSNCEQFLRAPVVIQTFPVDQEKISISSLWGGLLYIVVPKDCQLDKVDVTVEGAVQAPYFIHGETLPSDWLQTIRHYPAPWAELATESLILSVPSESVRTLENPAALLSLWDRIMKAICELAAIPSPFQRPERFVADVQISYGFMHSGYPIMCQVESLKNLVDADNIEANGTWGFIHELGHNQQRNKWEFPPHTTEATCNLWSVYVHEKLLGIPRHKAHGDLSPSKRQKRIEEYVRNGAKLEEWNVWTCLETYLQLQEGFGWDPFIQLFSQYQKMESVKDENSYKMNLWAERFSVQVERNLVPFFQAWGWPIEDSVSQKLSKLPGWKENPMRVYLPA